MQLELLVPRGWSHPTEQFLATWYTRIGYRVTRTGTIDTRIRRWRRSSRLRATS